MAASKGFKRYKAAVSVTRVTQVTMQARDEAEARESIRHLVSCWDGYTGCDIVKIWHEPSLKYDAIFNQHKEKIHD